MAGLVTTLHAPLPVITLHVSIVLAINLHVFVPVITLFVFVLLVTIQRYVLVTTLIEHVLIITLSVYDPVVFKYPFNHCGFQNWLRAIFVSENTNWSIMIDILFSLDLYK